MTVPTPSAFTGPYFPNGVTTQFPFTFKVNAESEVAVFYVEADGSETLVSPSDYTVELSSNQNNPGGTVTMASAPIASGRAMWIALDPVFTQTTKFEDEGAFNQSILNPTFDAGALRSIWLRSRVLRAISAPFGESGFTLPLAGDRANRFLGFGPTGDPLLSFGSGDIDGFRQDVGSADPALGSALVMYLAQGLGSVARLLRSKLSEMRSAGDKGADPTGVADSTVALQNLFTDMATTGRVNLLSGTYKVTKPLVIPPGIIEGGNVILDFRSANPADFPGGVAGVTVPGGAMTQLPNLASDLAIGGRLMTFVAAHGLAVGDSFNLSGTVDYAGNGGRAYYHKGEMFRVAYVIGDPATSTSVAVESACRDAYPAADVEIWKRSGDSFTNGCASLTILAPDTIGKAIRFVGLDLGNISRIRADGSVNGAIYIDNCFGMFGDNLKARQNVAGGDNYGICITNSQDIRLKGNVYGYFNGVTVGGGPIVGGLVGMSRDVHFEGIAASHPTGGLSGGNLHGNCENCSYRGVFINGITMSGNKNEAHGEFVGRSGQPAIIFSGMHGCDFTVTGIARTTGADLGTSLGAIHQIDFGKIGGDGVSVLRYGGRGKIDLRLYATNATRVLVWRPLDLARSDVVLDINLDIVEGHPTTRLISFSKQVTGIDLPLVEINRLNVLDTGGPAITWSVNAGTKFNNFRQDATVTVSGSGAASYAQAVTFPIPYPRAPRCQTTINGPSIAGTSPITETIKNVTATGGTVEVSTTDKVNQTVNSTVAVMAMSQ